MIASSTFSSDENLAKISLYNESGLIIVKNTLSFLLCPRVVYSTPKQSAFPIGCSERDSYNIMPGVRDDVFEAYVRMLGEAVGPNFMFMGNNAKPHGAHAVYGLFDEDIRRLNWPSKFPDLNPIYLRRVVA